MKHKVFIVIKDCSYDYDAELTVEPFGDVDEAVSRFNSVVNDCRQIAEEDEWVIDKDTSHSFSSYEEGYESQNHAYVRLQISEVTIK